MAEYNIFDMNDNNTERHSLGLLSEWWIRSAYKMS